MSEKIDYLNYEYTTILACNQAEKPHKFPKTPQSIVYVLARNGEYVSEFRAYGRIAAVEKHLNSYTMKKLLISSLLFVSATLFAANSYFVGSCDKGALSYKPGETMKFTLNIQNDKGEIVEGQKVKWTRRGDDGKTFSGEAVSGKDPIVI